MPQSAILFRITQEALANVREHAEASSVTVTLLERDDGHAVRIADDGCGFERARPPAEEGYGFVSMRARVRLGGGSLRVDSAPGAGTTVEAWLPRWQVGRHEHPDRRAAGGASPRCADGSHGLTEPPLADRRCPAAAADQDTVA